MKYSVHDKLKKLIILNLINTFKDKITFTGSFVDFLYTDQPISEVKDIDIIVPYKYKNEFIQKLLFDPFKIPKENSKQFYVVKLYNLVSKNTGFQHGFPVAHYGGVYSYTFSKRFYLNILGINIDVFFSIDSNNEKALQYTNLWINPSSNSLLSHKLCVSKFLEYNILNKEIRIKLLLSNIENFKNHSDKHKCKIQKYFSSVLEPINYISKYNDIPIFHVPQKYDTYYKDNKKKINVEFLNKDLLIYHICHIEIQKQKKQFKE